MVVPSLLERSLHGELDRQEAKMKTWLSLTWVVLGLLPFGGRRPESEAPVPSEPSVSGTSVITGMASFDGDVAKKNKESLRRRNYV